MHIYFTFISFVLGLVLASFINALLYRIDNGYKYPDIFIKGSHCEKCGKALKTYELIPVLSFIIFKGKCSKCGYKVPLYYPISELILGISMASIYYYSLDPVYYVLIIFMFTFSYFDRIYKWVPQITVNIFLGLSVIYFLLQSLIQDSIPENSILIGIGLSVFIWVLGKVMKKPFGKGDTLVLLGLSLLLNVQMYISFIYLFIFLSTLYSLILIAKKKGTFKSSVPLLPFMYGSMGILFFLNENITEIIGNIFY
ncbi:hypothetical protein A2436_01170 [candidate division WS6 bacterium RIFOXYC1_FULL_33_9]|nr:MAG: hypothetical protein A2369_01155 [candidate division WS6 bacterium RIFOXYB1_FULL_33_15]OGC37893.1 MAG: hypothetical protein A2436_01170 [candidate division WS6 bacterium RIFOXYC1_FULL_33_9]